MSQFGELSEELILDKLPALWIKTRLGNLVKLQSGYAFKSKEYSSTGVPILRMGNIQKDFKLNFDKKTQPCFPPDRLSEVETYLLQGGDIVITLTDLSDTGKYLGTVARLPENFRALLNQRVAKIVHGEYVDPTFVFYSLQQPRFRNYMEGDTTGTLQKNTNHAYVESFSFFLPPFNEQRRIVEKIEALTDRSRKARAALDQIPALLDQFRQSVLAAAFRGDLTADWRAQNPDIEPAEAFKYFYKNEIGWAIGKANDACIGVQSGSTPKGKPFTESGEVPFLKVYNIVNQQIDFDYRAQYVSREIHKTSLKRSITLPGDILMNIVGPPLGKIALVTEQFPEWNINQAIVTFRPKNGLISKYFYYYLREGSLVRDVVNETKGIVGQVNISLTQCRESIVKIPSLDEQAEIVRRIEGLFSLAASLSDAFKRSSEDLGELDQSILAKAFRGELVPQDPNDEPAALLLDRIRAERERLSNGKKRGKAKA